jgi:hypothetical protein
LPSGITGSWSSNTLTISGSSTVTGAKVYTITASNDCGSNSASGTITVSAANTITGSCTPECVIAGLTWSAPRSVDPSGCTLVSGGMTTNKNCPAQYKIVNNGAGYYYNWPCVNANATTICPSPWRVPTPSDLKKVAAAASPSLLKLLWGYPGRISGNLIESGSVGDIWSSDGTSYGSYWAHLLRWYGNTVETFEHYWSDGLQVRCVK